jgi:Tol biopolymer transport system component
MDADGSNQTRLTNYSSMDIYPAWSPDGTKIAFASDREGNWEIYVMDATPGSSPTRLTDHSSTDTAPAWSPDGTKIAFTSDRAGNDDLYVMDASDGSSPTLLLSHDQSISNPVWSHDGEKIAFQLFDGDIYVMNATVGSDITNLTMNGLFNEHPAWSSDGTQIAFTSKRDDNRDIYVMDADGSNQTRLTDHSLPDTKPIWSLDGTQIAFTRQDINANYQIYILSRIQELYLQTNNSSRIDNIYNSGTITITGEGSGTTSITGNTRTIMNYDGSTQIATVGPSFLSTPQDTWSYKIQYLTDRSSSISPDQLSGVPTATRIYTQPGLTVDGDPTSNGLGSGYPLYSTTPLSVDVGEIDAGEDFGIIQTRTFFSSNNVLAGTRRNLKTGDDEL